MSPAERIMVDAEGLAELLSCSRRHIQAMDASGALPMPVRLGRRTLWDVATIRRWCAAGCPSREQWLDQQGQAAGHVCLCERGRP